VNENEIEQLNDFDYGRHLMTHCHRKKLATKGVFWLTNGHVLASKMICWQGQLLKKDG